MYIVIAFVSGLVIGFCIGLLRVRGVKAAIDKQIMERYKKSMLGDP